MQVSGHLCGGAPLLKRYKISATFGNVGVPAIDGTTNGFIPGTTTDFADTPGLALDTGTYSTTQGDAEGLVTINIRGDAIIRALMSGAATESTALTVLSNTSASTDGLTVTDADVGSNDMDSGMIWCISGANVGQSRTITTHSGGASMAVTVPFLNDIAVGDEFLFCPWNTMGSGGAGVDGSGNLQATTLITQADATIASGTGGVIAVVDLELNGRTDSYVTFTLQDHVHIANTV